MLVQPDRREFVPATENIAFDRTRVEPVEGPGFLDVAAASFRGENLLGSLLSQGELGDGTPEEGYDFSKGVLGTIYEPYLESFAVKTFNTKQQAALMRQIDREIADRRTRGAAGWTGFLTDLGAGLLSPENLIPGGSIYRSVKTGQNIAHSALNVGAASSLAAGAAEVGLQASQEVRTGTESAFAIGGSAILGGILGAGAGAFFSRVDMAKYAKALDKELNTPITDLQAANENAMREVIAGAQSAGAASVARDSLDDLSIAGKAAGVVGGATWRLNPVLRALHSPSAVMRSVSTGLMEIPIYLKKNMEGRASELATETLVKEYTQGRLSTAIKGMSETYQAYRKGGGTLPIDEFRNEVGKAMRRGDQSDNPHISNAARLWRSEVFDPLKERAIEVGLLPKDVSVDTALSYFSRVYNRPKIEANEGAFKGIVAKWLSGQIDQATEAAAKQLDRRILGINAQRNEKELGILRRSEETRRRVEEGEIDVDAADEAQIVSMLKELQSGKKPPRPETLSEWVKRQKGGIFDPNGELAAVFPDVKSIPGLLRRTRRTDVNARGGDGLDDIVLRAWEEGFFNDAGTVRMGLARDTVSERPTIREFLDTLERDLAGDWVVRVADTEAARVARDFDRIEEALSRMGVDLQNPRFATSEATKDVVARINRVLDEFDSQEIAKLEKQVADLQTKFEADFPRFVSDADRQDYVDQIVNEIYNKITGREVDGDIPRDIVPAKRGPLKERTFNIPDDLIEDFLESDVEAVGRRYARVMAADVELQGKYGSTTLEQQIKDVREDYVRLRAAVSSDDKLTPEQKGKRLQTLNADEKRDVTDLKAVRDMLRGTYKAAENSSNFARVASVAGTVNYLRAMGGVVLSSAADVARHVMVHGLSNVMQDGIRPLITNMKGFRMSANEARLAGAVAERILNTRMATWAEVVDPYSVSSPFERFMENTARGFSKLNGMVYWNDFHKSFASVLTQNRVLRGAEGYASLKQKEKAYLAFLGIDEDMAARIAKEFEAHGTVEAGGVRVAHTDDWTDDLARRAYRAAINKDVDSIIVTKGIGDVPLFMRTPAGRLLTQFKSFALASHQRAFMRGLQEGPAGFVSGTLVATTIGMMIYALKSIESNRQEDLTDNPGRWIAEGLDRSGLFAVAFELNNTVEKALGIGAYGALQAAFPGSDQSGKASRYMVRSTAAALAGPTADFIDTIVKVVQGAKDGDLKESDVNAIRRLAPGATLPGIRSLVEYMVMPPAREAVAN